MMRIKQLVPSNRLYYKILLYFLSLLIPIVIIGIVTYANFVSKYKHDFAANTRMSLQLSAGQLDVHLRTVQEAGFSFFSESSVSRLLKPNDQYSIEDRANLLDILQSLKRTGTVLTGLADNLAVFIDHEIVYTTSGIDDFDGYFKRTAKYEGFGTEYWKKMNRSDRVMDIMEPTTLQMSQSEERVVPVLIGRLVRGYNAVLVANISVDALRDKLKGFAPFPSTQFVAMDGSGRVVFGPESDTEQQSVLIHKLTEAFPTDGSSSKELSIGQVAYIASYVQSALFGWKLYALTPVSEFNRQASGILRMIVVICLVLVVIGLLFSFIFTYKLYTPIQRIKDALVDSRDMHDDPQHAADEFDEIGIGIRRLVRHNQTTERKLNIVRQDYMDQALLHLMKDKESPNEAELHRMLQDRLGFAGNRYRCCGIHFQFKDAFYEQIRDEDRIVIWSKLKKLIMSFLNKHFRLHVVECTRHLYVCIIDSDGNGEEEARLRKAMDSLMQTFQFDLRYCILHVGIGGVHEGVKGIGESYKEAIAALQHQKGNRDCEIIEYERLDIRPNVIYTFTDEIKLLNLLKAGDAALKEKIGQYLQQQESRMSSHEFRVLITDVYRTGLRFVMEQGLERERMVKEERHRLLGDPEDWSPNIERRKAELLSFFELLAEELQKRQQAYKTNMLVAAITDMIESEYDRDLYLESISDRLGFSPKYVSRLFKEKTGMNITQYLSRVRVNKAKQLLANTDLSIADIAERVGIHSRTTFLRIFKKTEGVAPQSYREAELGKFGGLTDS